MSDTIREIEALDGVATAYKVTDSKLPAFDCVNAVKSHHAEQSGVDYKQLAARKVAENSRRGHFVVVVVEFA